MASLVDELCNACLRFSEATAQRSTALALSIGLRTGAHYAGGDWPRREEFSIEIVRAWLRHLVEDRGFRESFLAVGLARQIEDDFARIVDRYPREMEKRRHLYEIALEGGMDKETVSRLQNSIEYSPNEAMRKANELAAWRVVGAKLLQQPPPISDREQMAWL